MDPITEIALRIIAYLMLLRELFPRIEVLGELPPNEETLQEAIAAAVRRIHGTDEGGYDYALLSRINDTASRMAGESFKERGAAQAPKGIDDAVDRTFKEKIYRGSGWIAWLKQAWQSAKQAVGWYTLTVNRDVVDQLLDHFPLHVMGLRRLFPDLRLLDANGFVNRETLVQEILDRLVIREENGELMLAQAALAIDYVPFVVRKVCTDPDQQRTLLSDRYPRHLIELCRQEDFALPFALAFEEELDEIGRLRPARLGQSTQPSALEGPEPAGRPEARAFNMNLFGLAFSGGGIRSATVNLGILQALAAKRYLRHVDCLSTVSGGGYIGSWLLAWIKRTGSVRAVEEPLARYRIKCDDSISNPDPASDATRPIGILREYSNYLTPQAGFFTADTWTLVAIWMRNTFLNLTVLGLFLMGLLGLPRTAAAALNPNWAVGLEPAAIALLLFSSVLIALNLNTFERPSLPTVGTGRWQYLRNVLRPPQVRLRGDDSAGVVSSIALPLLISASLFACSLWNGRYQLAGDSAFWTSALFWRSSATLLAGFMITALVGNPWTESLPRIPFYLTPLNQRWRLYFMRIFRTLAFSIVPALVAGLLTFGVSKYALPYLTLDGLRGGWIIVAFGPAVMLLIYTVAVILYLGLGGIGFPDERREWWSRLGAWVGIAGLAWSGIACISFFGPLWIGLLGLKASGLGVSWVSITAAGARLAFGGKSGSKDHEDEGRVRSFIVGIAPYVFILGFLLVLTFGVHWIAMVAARWRPELPFLAVLPFTWSRFVEDYWPTLSPAPWLMLTISVGLIGLSAILAWRVDVNEFSMHHFYRNRLVRAYLGASRRRRHRRPNAFTGFDLDDDIGLSRFRSTDASTLSDGWTDCRGGYAGPFPIVNAALNTTHGEDLAWQERKAQSFVFTPLYSGFDFGRKRVTINDDNALNHALRPTEGLASGTSPEHTRKGRRKDGEVLGGFTIGSAAAISGAAANPNQGYHSSPAVAFLLTIFNVRLGWWLGNPKQNGWRSESPKVGLVYMLSELAGFSNTERKYVNLSDGGHFDNMGLYELVRRRCRFILLCDAEQDDGYTFEGLANAIRKCRMDFNVEVHLDPKGIKPARPGKFSKVHWATGTIKYPGETECGTIIYIKSSLTSDEPADVLEYRARKPAFPHQSTADQWFDETQFESYRTLGQHMAEEILRDCPDGSARQAKDLFHELELAVKNAVTKAMGGELQV